MSEFTARSRTVDCRNDGARRRGLARAKINLTLHVKGKRPDGYHELESLVVFADVCDELSFAPALEDSLTIEGPFATSDKMKVSIGHMLTDRKQRKFVETVDLQIGLKDYDPNKDKRFAGSVRLPYIPRPKLKVCVIADAALIDKCILNKIEYIDAETLKKKIDPNDKKGKELKKWARKYKLLFISESLVKQLTKLGGPFLTRWGKFPTVIQQNEDVKAKIDEGLQTVKFQLKKVLCLGTAVANAGMNEEQIRQNLNMSINYFVSLLKKGWNNVKSLYIRTTMGKPVKLF
jgi:large subunit ribosomal protein L10Ae